MEATEIANWARAEDVIDIANSIFDYCGVTPTRLDIKLKNNRRISRKLHSTRSAAEALNLEEISNFKSLSVSQFTLESDEISRIWTPRSCFSVFSTGRLHSVFVYFTDEKISQDIISSILISNFEPVLFQVYTMPLVYSPLSYVNGITYRPNMRSLPNPTVSYSNRLTNWVDHCYYGQIPSDGVLREVYETIYLSETFSNVKVDGANIVEWVNQKEYRGKIIYTDNNRYLWRIENENLGLVQAELDRNYLVASSFSPKVHF